MVVTFCTSDFFVPFFGYCSQVPFLFLLYFILDQTSPLLHPREYLWDKMEVRASYFRNFHNFGAWEWNYSETVLQAGREEVFQTPFQPLFSKQITHLKMNLHESEDEYSSILCPRSLFGQTKLCGIDPSMISKMKVPPASSEAVYYNSAYPGIRLPASSYLLWHQTTFSRATYWDLEQSRENKTGAFICFRCHKYNFVLKTMLK